VDRPTLEIARACYDARHDIYGNWSRAVQAAADYGIKGLVARFTEWAAVREFIERRIPIIASVRFAPGALPGAPLPGSEGHLIVVRGFDGRGHAVVNDPARRVAEGQRVPDPQRYPLEALGRAWFGGSGVGYVLGA
jgi:hypothetical protein